MNEAQTIGITGACGFIGTALRCYLANGGYALTALSRQAPTVGGYDHFIEYDIRKPPDPDLLSGINVLVHCAYVPFQKGIDVFKVNTQAAVQLASLASKSNTLLIFIGSMSANPDGRSTYGRQKAAIEKIFLNAGGTVLRPGFVLGSGGLFGRIKGQFENSRLIPLSGSREKVLKTIHIDDLCAAIGQVIRYGHRGCFNLGEPEAVSFRDFYTELSRAFGHEPRFIRLSPSLLLLAVRTAEMLHFPVPVDRDQVYGLMEMTPLPTAGDMQKLGCTIGDYRSSIKRLNIENSCK